MVKQKDNNGNILRHADLKFIELDKLQLPLANQFYKRVYKKGVASKDETVFILKDQEIICSAKLRRLDKQLLLTGVACDAEHRGQGYASQLIAKLLLLQKQPVYCFPYLHLQRFYSRLGFVDADPQQAPEIVAKKFYSYSKNRKLQLMVYNPIS